MIIHLHDGFWLFAVTILVGLGGVGTCVRVVSSESGLRRGARAATRPELAVHSSDLEFGGRERIALAASGDAPLCCQCSPFPTAPPLSKMKIRGLPLYCPARPAVVPRSWHSALQSLPLLRLLLFPSLSSLRLRVSLVTVRASQRTLSWSDTHPTLHQHGLPSGPAGPAGSSTLCSELWDHRHRRHQERATWPLRAMSGRAAS